MSTSWAEVVGLYAAKKRRRVVVLRLIMLSSGGRKATKSNDQSWFTEERIPKEFVSKKSYVSVY